MSSVAAAVQAQLTAQPYIVCVQHISVDSMSECVHPLFSVLCCYKVQTAKEAFFF